MAAKQSAPLELGAEAPDFRLRDTDGAIVARDDFADAPALLVVFLCNHCPYVRHISHALASFAREFEPRGLAVVGVNANDAERYPDDSYEAMIREKARIGYPFPYLHDENQAVARAYGAACTPDFFLFDADRRLVYRGQFDDSRPGDESPPTGDDLREAVRAVLLEEEVNQDQKPSVGCSIKWKPGQAPG